MAGETTSTNMSLPIPGTGVTSGPDWADDYNSCFTIIDAHTHGPGSGVQITPSGLNINADLPFGSTNSITTIKKVAFTSQSSALSGTSFLSFISGNLYVNDGSGNQIPITSGGGVAGSPGSIGSLASPAAATYSAGSKLFTWTADSGKAAAMDNGAVTIRETNVSSAKGVTILSASSLAADYNLTLPAALPGSTQAVNLSAAGVVSTISYDSIGSSMTSTGANAIGAAMTSTGANAIQVSSTRSTGTSVGAGGVAISSSCSSFSVSSSSYADVTNLSVTITTSGRPVCLKLIPDGNGSQASQLAVVNSGSNGLQISYVRGATRLTDSAFDNSLIWSPFDHIDPVATGTYTYKLQAKKTGSTNGIIGYFKLVAYEL